MIDLIDKFKSWYVEKNFCLLPKSYQDFLKSRLQLESVHKELDNTYLFSSFMPTNDLNKRICHRLTILGFMKKKGRDYYLTNRACSLNIQS